MRPMGAGYRLQATGSSPEGSLLPVLPRASSVHLRSGPETEHSRPEWFLPPFQHLVQLGGQLVAADLLAPELHDAAAVIEQERGGQGARPATVDAVDEGHVVARLLEGGE